MNSIWNKNIQLFKLRFPSLYEMNSDAIAIVSSQVSKNPAPFIQNVQIIQAKNGELTGKENNLALHSLYNPVREAENSVASKEVQEKQCAVFYGFGLGWQLLSFCRKYPEKKLIIIEPDVIRFFQSLTVFSWEEILAHRNLIIAAGCPQENILGLIEDQSKMNIGTSILSETFFFDIPAFTGHAQNYFEGIKTIIQRNIRKNQINEATLKKFGKLWIRNSRKNLLQLAKRNTIADFKDKGKQLPFLILGAGPSLKEIIPLLPELKKRMVIVCVETALHILLRNNFQPDFIVLMDPQFWAYRHIAGLKADSSILITELSTYPAVFNFKCRKILLSSSQFPVGKYFEAKCGLNCGDLGTGGSVASACWNFAYFCGGREIYTAGLDLGYPSRQTHIKGSSAEQTFHTVSRRNQTAENLTARTIFSAGAQRGFDYAGNEILTDSRMKMFAWWFEARIAACPDSKNYSLSSQSLKIPGMTFCPKEDVLKLPEISEKKKDFINLCTTAGTQEEALKKKLEAQIKIFPDADFFDEYPFLKNYF